jgi:7-keto-8-aminopelargonate synthetase-like enzyme
LGARPESYPPYGRGGGGSPIFENVSTGSLIHIASLSKAMGVPLAFAAGPAKLIDFLNRTSPSYTHSSQPAPPIVAAALEAIQLNERHGDKLRIRLASRVKQFVQAMDDQGIKLVENGYFPIQSLYFPSTRDAFQAGRALLGYGFWPLVQFLPVDHPKGGVLRFIISAGHAALDIQRLVDSIGKVAGRQKRIPGPARYSFQGRMFNGIR